MTSDGPSFQFNSQSSGEGAQINQGQHVSASQKNAFGGNPEGVLRNALEVLRASLGEVFAPVEGGAGLVVEPGIHPETLIAEAESAKELPAGEQEAFVGRWEAMLAAGGEAAAKVLAGVSPVVLAMLDSVKNPPFPYSIIAAGLKAAAQQYGGRSQG